MSTKISEMLRKHDSEDPTVKHQAMVLVYTTQEADEFSLVYNCLESGIISAPYYTGSKQNRATLDPFLSGEIRVLVVTGSLCEGFDHNPISVVAIARNVQLQSRVLFNQFVRRAVRKAYPDETIEAVLISHTRYRQRPNYDKFTLNEIADKELEHPDKEDD